MFIWDDRKYIKVPSSFFIIVWKIFIKLTTSVSSAAPEQTDDS